MVDARFFKNAGPFSLGDLAARIGGRLAQSAPPGFQITDIATLEDAGGSELSVFTDTRYRDSFRQTRAGAVLTSVEFANEPPPGGAHLIFARRRPALPMPRRPGCCIRHGRTIPSADPRAMIVDATLGDGSRISRGVVLGSGAVIGARTQIGPNAVIRAGVIIGDDCVIGANATISHAIIGNRVQIFPGAAIGVQGFGFVPSPRGLRRVPQLGRVMIGDDVEIGANSTIDRGAIGDTIIGRGTVIDNLVHIAHNVRIGQFCVIAAQAGIAGSTEVGDHVMIGGHAGIKDHLTIGSGAQIAGAAGVIRDVAAGSRVAGYPAIPVRDWHRQTIGLRRMFSRSQ